jgi:hypothetical protein
VQISLRSHLIAGTAAVVGASAIAMTPVMGAQLSLPSVNVPTVAKVTLAGLDSPISELLGSVILGGQLLFNTTYYLDENGDPNPAFNRAAWGPTAFPFAPTAPAPNAGSAPVFPVALESDALGGYSSVGLVPQIIDDALPIVRQLGINGSDYLNTSIFGLSAAGVALSEGVWNAAGQLLTLDIPGALQTLGNSISAAGTLALASGAYVLGGVVARAQAVVEAVAGSLPLLIGATVAQVTLVVNRTIAVVTDTFAATSFEGGWNAAIDGIFGATGIPGTLLNLTIGAGQQTGPIPYGPVTATPPLTPTTESIAENYVPSLRTEVQTLVKGVANALATPNPVSPPLPVASAKSVRSAAAARTAAVEAAPAAEAPAAEAPAAEAPAAEAPAAESSAPVKHRSARAVSKRASANN